VPDLLAAHSAAHDGDDIMGRRAGRLIYDDEAVGK
jgi:hypothetical protein